MLQVVKRISLLKLDSMNSEALLKIRFCELDIDLQETWLALYIDKLYSELDRAGLPHLRPKAYFGDEWFCPDGSTRISVPFYLAHRRLAALEKKFIGKAEGGSPQQLLRLLRHETGHCFNHAYRLFKTKEWQALFGSPKQPYNVETYEYDPTSKNFVRHLSGYYAQSHPDEDFAETFAVWLAPRSRWREKYKDWPVALKKLEYIDRKVKDLHNVIPFVQSSRPMSHVRQLRSTLGRYYRRRKPIRK